MLQAGCCGRRAELRFIESLLSLLRMHWAHEPGDGSAGASPYRAHPTTDGYRRGGGSWRAHFRFAHALGP
ncbi:hypothetical protein SBV1_2290019 [Verrucomicrobia bacterium]|nr:hypothetical protein SBV1_2290019 [Verrucomicrobiota bacterium]